MNARQRRRGRRWRQRVTDEIMAAMVLPVVPDSFVSFSSSMSSPVVRFSDGKVHTMTGFEGAPSWPWSSGLTWSGPEVV